MIRFKGGCEILVAFSGLGVMLTRVLKNVQLKKFDMKKNERKIASSN